MLIVLPPLLYPIPFAFMIEVAVISSKSISLTNSVGFFLSWRNICAASALSILIKFPPRLNSLRMNGSPFLLIFEKLMLFAFSLVMCVEKLSGPLSSVFLSRSISILNTPWLTFNSMLSFIETARSLAESLASAI